MMVCVFIVCNFATTIKKLKAMKKITFILSMTMAAIIAMPQVAQAQSYDDDIYVIEKTGDIPANETKKERKERIKKDHQSVDSIFNLKAVKALQDGYFVLQATEVRGSRGAYSLGLNDNTNFLLAQGDKGIFQVAFDTPNPGANGLGGVTLHGRINKKNITQDKKGNVVASFDMVGRNMHASVTITVYSDSDQAIADVFPTMGNGRFTLRGRLVPYTNDKITITP